MKKPTFYDELVKSDWLGRESKDYTSIRQTDRAGWERELKDTDAFSKYILPMRDDKGLDPQRKLEITKMLTRKVVSSMSNTKEPINILFTPEFINSTNKKSIVVSTEALAPSIKFPTFHHRLDVIMGEGVHEMAHILYTDSVLDEFAFKDPDPSIRSIKATLANILEDERIEMLVGDCFAGFANYLAALRRYVFEYRLVEVEGAIKNEQDATGEDLTDLMFTILHLIRYPRMCSRELVEKFEPELKQVIKILSPYPKTSTELVSCANAIYNIIMKYYKKQLNPPKQQPGQPSQSSDEGEGSDGEQQQSGQGKGKNNATDNKNKDDKNSKNSKSKKEDANKDSEKSNERGGSEQSDAQAGDEGESDMGGRSKQPSEDAENEDGGSDNGGETDGEDKQDESGASGDGEKQEDESNDSDGDGQGGDSEESPSEDEVAGNSEGEGDEEGSEESKGDSGSSSPQKGKSEQESSNDSDSPKEGGRGNQGSNTGNDHRTTENQEFDEYDHDITPDEEAAFKELVKSIADKIKEADPTQSLQELEEGRNVSDMLEDLDRSEIENNSKHEERMEQDMMVSMPLVKNLRPYELGSYFQDMSKTGNKSVYDKTLTVVNQYAPLLRSSIQKFNRNQSDTYRGLYEGEFDEESLVEAVLGAKNVYKQRAKIQNNGVTVVVLIDESGSMTHDVTLTRALAVLFERSLNNVNGVDYYCYGHTTTDSSNSMADESTLIHVYYEGKKKGNRSCLAKVNAYNTNRDGHALLLTVDRVRKFTDKEIVLFMISDGDPSASVPTGYSPVSYTKACVEELEKHHKCQIIHIASNTSVKSEKMFSKYVKFRDMKSLVSGIGSIIKTAVTKFQKPEVIFE